MENQYQNNQTNKIPIAQVNRVAELRKIFIVVVLEDLIAIIITLLESIITLNEWYYPWFLWVVFGVGLSLVHKRHSKFLD